MTLVRQVSNERFPEKITFRLKDGKIPETDYLQIRLSLKSEGTVTIDLTPEETERLRHHWLKRRKREYLHLVECAAEIVKTLGRP